MKIFGIKNCDKVRNTLKWCKQNNVDCQLHDYRINGIDKDLINMFLQQYSIEELVNKRSTTWRTLTSDEKESLSIDVIIANPTLLKRPIVDINNKLHIGYFPDKWI